MSLVKLEMLIAHVLPCIKLLPKNSRIYPTSTVAPKFATFESSWLQRVGNIVREGAQNTHQWPEL